MFTLISSAAVAMALMFMDISSVDAATESDWVFICLAFDAMLAETIQAVADVC